MRKTLLSATALCTLFAGIAHADEKEFPATLESHAILPANTIIPAPADAPEHLKTSGKFSTPDRKRADALGTVPGKDGVRLTGLSLPFDGQAGAGFLRHQEHGRRHVLVALRQRLRQQAELRPTRR